MRLFEMMRTCFFSKTLWTDGGLGDQPSWFYDIYKDPKEEHGVMAELLWAWVPFDDFTRIHNELIEKYPHRKPYRSVIEK